MTKLPFFGYSLYEMFHYFMLWSFIGWMIEIVDMTFETGEYQNRGFLNMPICPIYGVGVLLIHSLLTPFTNHGWILFILSTIICTSLELGVGLLLEAVFHSRWWDYSHMYFNFKGLICLRNSLFFGAACVLMMKKIQPAFEIFVAKIPVKLGVALIIIYSILIIVDLIASVSALIKFNERLVKLDEIGKKMLSVSQKIGGVLADGTINIKDRGEKFMDKAGSFAETVKDGGQWVKGLSENENAEREEDMKEYSGLKEKYEKLLSEKSPANRFINALPTLTNNKYSKVLHDLKHKVNPDSAEHFELKLDEVKKKRNKKR